MHSKDASQKSEPAKKVEETKDLRQANEHIREAQDEDDTGRVDARKTGNKPALDRGR